MMREHIPNGWEKAPVRVRVGDVSPDWRSWRDAEPEDAGDGTVPGFVSSSGPGLAITPAIGRHRDIGVWRITHIASGYALGDAFTLETLTEAADVAARVGRATDWTVGHATLTERMRSSDFRSRVRRLAQAPLVANGAESGAPSAGDAHSGVTLKSRNSDGR